jgi:hypothetical protein
VTCPGCETPLADEQQRFCVACGLRVAPDELRLAALPVELATPVLVPHGPRQPVLRTAAVTAVVVLTMGIGMGAAIGPAAVGETVAAQRPVIVVAGAPAASVTPLPDEGNEGEDEEPAVDEPAGETPAPAPPPAPTEEPPPVEPTPVVVPDPGLRPLAGVAVATDATGRGFTLVTRDGRLLAVDGSGCDVVPGDSLHLLARPLASGAWQADRARRVREGVTSVRLRGRVVWTDPAGGRYALGARGVTVLVRVPTAAALPAIGAELGVRIDVLDELVQRRRQELPQPVDPELQPTPPPLELAGTLASVDAQARTVVLALDDAYPPTATVTLPATEGLDLVAGTRVGVSATIAPDGSYAVAELRRIDDPESSSCERLGTGS